MRLRIKIKKFLKNITTSEERVKIKKFIRHTKSLFSRKSPKTTLLQLQEILQNELGLKAGDRIIVSSSFGNMNAEYSPYDVIELLKSIVTEDGLIMMPYYPPVNSDEWAKKGSVFDMNETKSGMGVLTNVFAKQSDVHMSIHPTKAVCAWGKEAEEIISGHENSTTPFFWDSPYGKLLKKNSKSLCLGLKNIPIFHSFEDILFPTYDYCYLKNKYNLSVLLEDKSKKTVSTYVHDSSLFVNCIPAGDYVKDINPKTYKRIPFGLKYIAFVDNDDLFAIVRENFNKGYTRLIK